MLKLHLCLKTSLPDHAVRLTYNKTPLFYFSLTAGLNLSYIRLLIRMELLSRKSRALCSQLLKEKNQKKAGCPYARLHPSAFFFSWHARVLVKVPVSFICIRSALALHGVFPTPATNLRWNASTCKWHCTFATWMVFLNDVLKEYCGSARGTSINWEIWERSEVFCARFTWKWHWGS